MVVYVHFTSHKQLLDIVELMLELADSDNPITIVEKCFTFVQLRCTWEQSSQLQARGFLVTE